MHTIDLTNAWEPPVAGSRAAARSQVWVRWFGRPSGLGPGDRVWLVMDLPPPADATLNGAALPAAAGAWRIDVTDRLEPRNELVLLLDADGGGGRRAALPAPCGGVRLEIEVA